MKAVAVTAFGGPEVLQVISLPAPEAAPGQIRIRVTAAAVNPADAFLRSGGAAPRLRDIPPPYVPGWEAAGVVDQVGEGARTDLRPGDHAMAIVIPRGTHGAYAEQVAVPAESAALAPAGASDAEAATLPMTGLTARLALDLLALRPGQTVAVTGAAGAVGGYAVQLAKAGGLHVIADASPADRHLVQALGADITVARGPAMPGQVRDALPAGADGLVSTVPLTAPLLRAVKDRGSIAAVRGGHAVTPERGITVHRVFVPRYASEHGKLETLRQQAEDGQLALRVARAFPAGQAAIAHQILEAGGTRGRLVLRF
jgi:NADPH2:quinone reductase